MATQRRPSVRQRRDDYVRRVMAALAVVLLLCVVVVRTPLRLPANDRVGWQIIRHDEVIALEDIRLEDGFSSIGGVVYDMEVPAVRTEAIPESPENSGHRQPAESARTGGESTRGLSRVERLERLVLAAAETMPQIKGGLGAYYINIDYPQAAVDAGIEGRLVLDFVVETDGRPSNIEVYKPLHPLCDSAAVRALRKTLFMPGQSDGQAVAVHMRLPVLFQITRPAPEDSTAS